MFTTYRFISKADLAREEAGAHRIPKSGSWDSDHASPEADRAWRRTAPAGRGGLLEMETPACFFDSRRRPSSTPQTRSRDRVHGSAQGQNPIGSSGLSASKATSRRGVKC